MTRGKKVLDQMKKLLKDDEDDSETSEDLDGKVYLSITYDNAQGPDLYLATEEEALQVIRLTSKQFKTKSEPVFIYLTSRDIFKDDTKDILDDLRGGIRIDKSIRSIRIITTRPGKN